MFFIMYDKKSPKKTEKGYLNTNMLSCFHIRLKKKYIYINIDK